MPWAGFPRFRGSRRRRPIPSWNKSETKRGSQDSTIRKALILAAGRGTRLGSLTADKPKPMVEAGSKPILEWILLGLKSAGIAEFVIVTGYRQEVLRNYFGDGEKWGIRIEYVHQEKPEGTARAVLTAKSAVGDSPFFLSWGDVLVEPRNYRLMKEVFVSGRVDAVLAVNRMQDPCRGSSVVFDADGKVQRIVEKPPPGTAPSPYNGSGVFCFHPEVFEFAERVSLSVRGEYEFPDVLSGMIEAGREIRVHRIEGYWGDVGTPGDLARMNDRLDGR